MGSREGGSEYVVGRREGISEYVVGSRDQSMWWVEGI